jgi:hypothetical protein
MLIGLTGPAGSGKDTVANVLGGYHKFAALSYAKPLKRAASEIFKLPIAHFYDEALKEVINEAWGMTPRTMLQKLGTEACRNGIHQDIWLKSLQVEANLLFADGYDIVISDVRFENEAAQIRSLGGVVVHVVSNRKSRLDATAQAHASEAGVKFVKGSDFVFHNTGAIADIPRTTLEMLAELSGVASV